MARAAGPLSEAVWSVEIGRGIGVMVIPRDWLRYPTTPDEVEGDLAELGVPDLWFRRWRALLDRLAPGDELWVYGATEYEDPLAESADEIPGFVQIHGVEIPSPIAEGEPGGRIVGFRGGFALVRDGEIVDWIESLP